MRYIVDAMNVIGSRPDRWWNDPDKAMNAMAEKLNAYAIKTGEDIELVFDRRPKSFDAPDSIKVVFAKWKGRNAADHEIEEIVQSDEDPRNLIVVTSDKRLVDAVKALGARVESSGRFRTKIEKVVPQ
jgi:predicted RNA-binding protein with PIN domain